jgi:hypothetical protein
VAPRARSFVAASFAGAIGACSLGDFSGYSSGGPPVPDASDAAEAGPSPADAGADARDAVDASGFCASKGGSSSFCEDFDGDAGLSRFTFVQTSGGTAVVDDASSTSAPRSMLVTSPAAATPQSVFAIVRPDATARARVQLSAAIRLEAIDATSAGRAQLLKVWFFEGDDGYEVTLAAHAQTGKLLLFEYREKTGYYQTLADLDDPAPTSWTRIDLDVRIGGPGGPAVSLDRDGKRLVDGAVLSPPFASGVVESALGLPYIDGAHGAWTVRIDDVLLR